MWTNNYLFFVFLQGSSEEALGLMNQTLADFALGDGEAILSYISTTVGSMDTETATAAPTTHSHLPTDVCNFKCFKVSIINKPAAQAAGADPSPCNSANRQNPTTPSRPNDTWFEKQGWLRLRDVLPKVTYECSMFLAGAATQ